MKSTLFRALVGLLALPLIFSTVSGCDEEGNGDDFQRGEAPQIDTDKDTITFNVVEIGNSAEQVFTIINQGSGPLNIANLEVTGPNADLFQVFIERNVEYVPNTEFTIDPAGTDGAGENSRQVQVRFTPNAVGAANATLMITHNDPRESVAKPYPVILQALETGPQPLVNPSPIIFGQVAGGETVKQDVTITNVGSAPLDITDIYITGSLDFSVEAGVGEQRGGQWHIYPPTDPMEVGGSKPFKLQYAPPVQGPDSGDLIIVYDFGGQSRQHVTKINANGADPCIRVDPSDVVDFGQSVIGKTKSQLVTVQNCGTEDLSIFDIYLTPDSDTAVYSVVDLPAEIQASQDLILGAGSSRAFSVVFAPFAESTHTGTLVFESDALNQETKELPITGTGSTNNCPTAVAEGRVRDALNPNAPYFTELEAEPLDYLELTAKNSSDPDGDRIDSYTWTVVKAPEGFSLNFERSNREVSPQIQLALIGDYIFELNVKDENGADACEKARVTVAARSDKDLIVELTWRTPADPDETDTGLGNGTDLDLHFLEPDGTWNDFGLLSGGIGSDCYFNNLRPDWQTPKGCVDTFNGGIRVDCCTLPDNRADAGCADNPNLDRDDTDGGGPEQVNIRTPKATNGTGGSTYNQPYAIGADYYAAPAPVIEGTCSNDGTVCELNSDCGEGNTCDSKRCVEWCSTSLLATVRIFLLGSQVPAVIWPTKLTGGEQARELITPGESESTGDFWLAGELDWDGTTGQPTERDEVYTGFPDYNCSPVCDGNNRCACQ